MFDNGAFTAFTQKKPMDEKGFITWCRDRLQPPHFAVIPDVIGGDVPQQRDAIKRWPFSQQVSAPVWHLDKSLDYLKELLDNWPRICFGSAGEYWKIGSSTWLKRMDDAYRVILSRASYDIWMHGLRMSGVVNLYPFGSVDSTNVARNHKNLGNTQCPDEMAKRIDSKQSPSAVYFQQKLKWEERIANYVKTTGFPKSLFIADDGRVVGTLIMGNDYRVKSTYYGGYPAGYLHRMKALFPDKHNVLHLFSGKVDTAVFPGHTVDLDPALNPDYLDDAQTLENVSLELYDLVLADPPYSVEDAEHYGPTMVKRNKVMAALVRLPSGAHVIWLDQVLPMYRKDQFAIEACIGLVKSTNHRFRVVIVFRKL